MADSRTPEQRAADEALTAAVQTALSAYEMVDEATVNVRYMVLVEQRVWSEDGYDGSGVSILFQEGSMPWPAIIGLLRAATLQQEHNYMSKESGE